MKKQGVIIFDLDDTLFPEKDYALSGFQAVGAWLMQQKGWSGFAESAWDLFERGTRGLVFNKALVLMGREPQPELVAEMVGIYRRHEPLITSYPDASKSVSRLQKEGRSIGVITDGYLVSQQAKVKALGLDKMIPCIVYTDALGRDKWKPHPASFELVMVQYKANGTDCVYIGDNPMKDFVGARKLGWTTVRIRRPDTEWGAVEAEPGYEADYEIKSLEELGV